MNVQSHPTNNEQEILFAVQNEYTVLPHIVLLYKE